MVSVHILRITRLNNIHFDKYISNVNFFSTFMRFAIDDRNHKLQVHITKCTGRHVKMILFKFPGFFSFRTFAFLNNLRGGFNHTSCQKSQKT